MIKIVRIHEKILDHLLQLRNSNPSLFFVPRKINNQQRLEKGFWFLGNQHYLHLSFWNGTDWKEKIHNIGFVVLKNGNTYIELSAQDSKKKAVVLKKIADQIGGFRKEKSKNKWYKNYDTSDYIQNLNSFISEIKPVIDDIILKENLNEISLLNEDFFEKYIKKIQNYREEQVKLGKKNKLARICWNTENWKYPSGSQGKSTSSNSYEALTGYGHEEWLFDRSKFIDGYQYSFLQPLLLKSDRHVNKNYNISLFTINNLNKRYYVGEIKNVNCISKQESKRISEIYREKGWLKNMRNDVAKVGADTIKFDEINPRDLFNIRFKWKDVSLSDDLVEISNDDINITTHRYKLLPRKSDFIFETYSDPELEESKGNRRNTNKRKKVFNVESEYDPFHAILQNEIFDLLEKSDQYNYKKVFIEKGRVDIKALTQDRKWHYFEIKTDNPKLSVRKALGQILEYSYYPDQRKAEKLIIVAGEKPTNELIRYLTHIRKLFDLPISYRSFDLDTKTLSDDF